MPLGRLYASLSVEKSESWGMRGLKGSRRVQSNIESTRRKLSVKPASNVLPSHSVGIRIRKTITKQVVQRYLPIYGANLSIYEIENVDDGHGHFPTYLRHSSKYDRTFCYKRSYAVERGDRQRGRWMPFPARFSKHSCR